jgi:hypothetical protein
VTKFYLCFTWYHEPNFLIWHQQVLANVRGLNLEKYIHKDYVLMKYTSKEDETNCVVNKEFLNFEQQDQLLMAWLLDICVSNACKGQETRSLVAVY